MNMVHLVNFEAADDRFAFAHHMESKKATGFSKF